MPSDPIIGDLADSTCEYAWEYTCRRIKEKGDKSFVSSIEAFGTIIEEYAELLETVHLNNHPDAQLEVMDIYVPCVFEWASIEQGRMIEGKRSQVREATMKKAHSKFSKQVVGDATFHSIHDLLGGVTKAYRNLEIHVFESAAPKIWIEHLAIECLRASASIASGKMDW